ncbi:MAG: hypothetical protein BWY82_01397 [Verrucomicrobia bacterium ADurb.Bin474]|nr:MAG: hypothetical protein BWY82_01397 [Verrucomicrobia bacterium ADurb.Bin474]
MTIRRIEHALHEMVPRILRKLNRAPSGKRHATIPLLQRLHRLMDPQKRARTCGLHIHAGPFEVQLVGHPGRHVVLVIGDHQVKPTHRVHRQHLAPILTEHECIVREQVIRQVTVHARRRINSNPASIRSGIVAGILKGVPCRFQKDPLLRVNHPGFFAGVFEKLSIKILDPIQNRGRLHMVREVHPCAINPFPEGFLSCKKCDGLPPFFQNLPEAVLVRRPRESAGHPDYRNRRPR